MIIRFGKYKIKISKYHECNIIGLQSYVNKKKDTHILFLDYDEISILDIIKDLRKLKALHNLGECYIFQTNKGYHVYELTPRSFEETFKIIIASKSDEKHKIAPFFKKDEHCWTLRISEKNNNVPKFKYVLNNYSKTKISDKHFSFLYNYFNLPFLPSNFKKRLSKGELFFVNYYQKEAIK